MTKGDVTLSRTSGGTSIVLDWSHMIMQILGPDLFEKD
jgi:hypothetical protein